MIDGLVQSCSIHTQILVYCNKTCHTGLKAGDAQRFLDRLRWAGQQIKADPLGTYSYFRRAVRPNEIFFVYGAEELPLLTGSMHCPLVTSACE